MPVTEILEQSQNGNGSIEHDNFPVESFRDAAQHLRRPFTAEAVKFKVQSAYPKNGPTGALIVAYIDARLVAERLNLVCPHLWHDEYEPLAEGRMMCALTVDGITRRDIGEGYKGKGLYSDAFKRAGVKFGIGVPLYAVPAMRLTVQSGDLRSDGKAAYLTIKGENSCRYRYRQWLHESGIAQFGDPLDHGDALDSTGDIEAEEIVTDEESGTTPETIAKQIVDRAWKIPKVKEGFQLAASFHAGRDVGECNTKPKAVKAVQTLTLEQATALDERITKAEADAA